MSKVPLNSLPTFVAVARLQNVRAAAERLYLTPGAVSQQILALEERIGFALFERHGRRVVLNEAGAALLAGVEPALLGIRESVAAAAQAAGRTGATLRLNVVPSLAQRWLMPRLKRWRDSHPDIALEIEASAELMDLERDGCHVALRGGDGPWAGLVAEKLYEAPARFVVVGSPAAARRLAGLSDAAIADEPLLDSGGAWVRWFEDAGLGRAPLPTATFNEQGLMLQAAEEDLGIAVVRELLVGDALRDGRLVQLSATTFIDEGYSWHSLVYPAGLRDWAPLIALRAWLREEFDASLASLRDGQRA